MSVFNLDAIALSRGEFDLDKVLVIAYPLHRTSPYHSL